MRPTDPECREPVLLVGEEDSSSVLKKVPSLNSEHGDTSIASMASTAVDTASARSSNTRSISADEEIKILGEIVGGYKLFQNRNDFDGDTATTSVLPYCEVLFGRSPIHCTDEISGGGDSPVWTLSSRSLFLWEATPRELAQHKLQVSVWGKQRDPLNITTLETFFLGKAEVGAAEILANHCREERLDLDLLDKKGAKTGGTLTMRFRLSTTSDEAFLARLYRKPKEELPVTTELCIGVKPVDSVDEEAEIKGRKTAWDDGRPVALVTTEVDETEVAGTSFFNTVTSAFAVKSYLESESGQVKVKPGPDPKRVDETTYMKPDEIRHETTLPSHEWIEAGSGTLGKIYLEILSCKDLPNVDVGEAVGNVTDCFITAVFEDTMVQTPVIDDELSPHWLPWMQRAFCINIMHPASILYIGAFDFDLGLSDHDPLGRVAVNVSNLQRNTDYTLTYNLYPSSHVTDRTSAGSITIRLRIEYEDEKAALLAALQPRPKFHVNVNKEKTLKVVNYTCFGEFGDQVDQEFDLTVIRSYINEIVGYKNSLKYSIGNIVQSLVFWRGQVRILDFDVPLHSFILFTALTTLIEKPYLTPPFTLLGIGWVMLASLTQRRQHPSPWNDCPPFLDYVGILHHGKPSEPVLKIDPNERLAEIEAYEKASREHLERNQKEANERWERQQHIEKIGDEAIHTKVNSAIPLDLLVRLKRYQGIIGRYCRHIRFIKMIATWEEGVVSFWFTVCVLAAGFFSLLLPWAFIMTWTSRTIVWGLLGPHMLIVDIILRDKDQEETIAKAFEQFQKDSNAARQRRQDALKLKDAKSLAFGQYATLVPAFNLSRYFDYPLPCSFAVYADTTKSQSIKFSKSCIPGQHLVGQIVPRPESQMESFDREYAQLENVRVSAMQCVKNLKWDESKTTLRRMREYARAIEERDMPTSVGFELVSFQGSRDSDESSSQSEIGEKTWSLEDGSTEKGCCSLPGQASMIDCILPIAISEDSSCCSQTPSIEFPVHVDAERKLAVVHAEETDAKQQEQECPEQMMEESKKTV